MDDHVTCVDSITPIGLVRIRPKFNFNVAYLNDFNVTKSQDRLVNENALTRVFITAQLINQTMWCSPREIDCPDGFFQKQ